MGKYQLDTKGKAAVTKYYEKLKPVQGEKNQKVAELRAKYLKNKQAKDGK